MASRIFIPGLPMLPASHLALTVRGVRGDGDIEQLVFCRKVLVNSEPDNKGLKHVKLKP